MKKFIYSALLLTLTVAANSVFADEKSPANFMVSPKQCTSLKQGEVCYVDLEVSWHVLNPAEYCLYADQQKLNCWTHAAAGQWQQALKIQDDTVISLRSGSQPHLYSQTIRYAWMHKKNTSNAMRWRLF